VAVLGKPVDVVADDVAADFDAAVVAVDGLDGFQFFGRGVIEIAFDTVVQRGLVFRDCKQVIGAAVEDNCGDLGLASPGADSLPLAEAGGDQRTFQFETLEQQRDGSDLVGLDVRGFLTEDEALARRPGGDQVQRLASLGLGMSATGPAMW